MKRFAVNKRKILRVLSLICKRFASISLVREPMDKDILLRVL